MREIFDEWFSRIEKNLGWKLIGILLLFLLWFLQISCNSGSVNVEQAGSDEYYTCSMDPQVIENRDGICPICHMKLIKVKKNNLRSGQIKLSKHQIRLANISYDTLRVHEISREIKLTGRVTVDQNFSEAISAKVQGRIETLAFKNEGDFVRKGQLLFSIYSEDLSSAQQEYLLSLRQSGPTAQFTSGARRKLLLMGMREPEIQRLTQTGKAMDAVPVVSNVDGYVTNISVAEGDYVSEGTVLFRVAAFHSLWVEAELFLPYLPYLHMGTEARFTIPAAVDSQFTGKVIFIDPQVQAPNRLVLARLQVMHPSPLIKPGMMADITIETEKRKVLTLPLDAIIQSGSGANVWVRNKDGIFENKPVKVGMQNSKQIEILQGLEPGEVVVVSGTYLLNSEYIFKKGANPSEGTKM